MNKFETYLSGFSEADWLSAVDAVLPEVHAVDRDALQIWFRFFPLSLRRFIEGEGDRESTLKGFAMQGEFELDSQIDTSHHFLYGHRYWKAVKAVIEKESKEFADDGRILVDVIKGVACETGHKVNVDRPLTLAISTVGLMTFNQVGAAAFLAAVGDTVGASGNSKAKPEKIAAEREKDKSQGLFGFLKTIDKKFVVHFDATYATGDFTVTNEEEIASASQKDRSREWQTLDSRCWEGPVPIECTAASCGTCWVGVVGGKEKLSPVQTRERRQMKVFGYNQPEEAQPFLRLACQARATGNVSIVIPPWNGVFGKKVYGNVESVELEPATTSAKNLRKAIAGK